MKEHAPDMELWNSIKEAEDKGGEGCLYIGEEETENRK